MVGKRVSDISSSEELFSKAKPLYDAALEKSGYKEKIQYSATETKTRKNRPRKITWFNPPYNHSVKSNVGKIFQNLVEIHFPKHHCYNKLFNKNNLKLSYSCMPNMSKIISNHNKKILNPVNVPPPSHQSMCNCRLKSACPMEENCLQTSVVYKATVTSTAGEKIYIGCTEGTFKTRFTNHKQSFQNEKYAKATALSTHIWALKRSNIDYNVKWKIISKASKYLCGTRKCDLCLTEKVLIASADPKLLLNSRAELISKCRHQNKYLLMNQPD